MNHIEFIGPPGSGKSTILAQLADRNPQLYTYEQSIPRYKAKENKIWKYYQYLPERLKTSINKYIPTCHCRSLSFNEFIDKNPDYLKVIPILLNLESVELFKHMKGGIERHQMGSSTVKEGELLVLDENFQHYGAHLLANSQSSYKEVELYFKMIPTPKILIHVDAPTEVCIARRCSRGERDSQINHKSQERFRESCESVVNHANKEITIIQVSNIDTITEGVKSIESSLSTCTDLIDTE